MYKARMNTIRKREFLPTSFFWQAVSAVWYRLMVFKCIPGLETGQSRVIFWMLTGSFSVIGTLTAWHYTRNKCSIFFNAVMPCGVYTLVSFYRYLPWVIWPVAAVTGILTAVLSKTTYLSRKKTGKGLNRRRSQKLLIIASVKTAIAVGLIIIIGYILAIAVFGNRPYTGIVSQAGKQTTAEMLEDNKDVLANLDQDVWQKLSIPERIKTIQAVADIERAELHLPHELNVTLGNLSGNTLAAYDKRTYRIIIDFRHFEEDSAESLVDSVCHESYHALERVLCDLYESVDEDYRSLEIFNDISSYYAEFNNYTTPGKNLEGYYNQICEADARKHARETTERIYRTISETEAKGVTEN